jgi:hypothetical protein
VLEIVERNEFIAMDVVVPSFEYHGPVFFQWSFRTSMITFGIS